MGPQPRRAVGARSSASWATCATTPRSRRRSRSTYASKRQAAVGRPRLPRAHARATRSRSSRPVRRDARGARSGAAAPRARARCARSSPRGSPARRLPVVLMTAFGALALLLASVGVYAMFASMAAAREREFGVRVALGSTPARASRALVLRQGGVWMAARARRRRARRRAWSRGSLRDLLYGVPPFDPIALGARGGACCSSCARGRAARPGAPRHARRPDQRAAVAASGVRPARRRRGRAPACAAARCSRRRRRRGRA